VTEDTDKRVLKLGTRGSMLARMQSQSVANELMRICPNVHVELVIISTSGDRIQDRPLNEVGGKGLFTKELELALLDARVDFAVHSYKDVPITEPLVAQDQLVIAAVPKREIAADLLITQDGRPLDALPQGARVATGSMRRRCQLLSSRPDLRIVPIRGNVDTRLRKLRAGEFDAVVLAYAGVVRAGLFEQATMHLLPADVLLPAPGQGALALQCRSDDTSTRQALGLLNDPSTALCVASERRLVELLHGDCHSPIAAWARLDDDRLTFEAAVGKRDGSPPVLRTSATGISSLASEVVDAAFAALNARGVTNLLNGE